jgi:hypothetical protein
MKIFIALLLCSCGALTCALIDQQKRAQALYDSGILGQAASAKAMAHVIDLLQAGQAEKALQWQKNYLGVVRAGLINAQKEGFSSGILDEAIVESDRAIK